MNRNFIFVFILFAAFSMINAVPHQFRKRETTFIPCPGVPDSLTVTISPADPPVSGQPETFTVSGTLTKNIVTADKTVVAIAYGDLDKNPYTQKFTQSFKAGEQFSITANDVPTPQLSNTYAFGVAVGDPTDDPNIPIDIHACAFAIVRSGKKRSNAERGYPIAERSFPIAELF